MPCTMEFGTVFSVEPHRDYSDFPDFQGCLRQYGCIAVEDDLANRVLPFAEGIPSYLFSLERPSRGIDHYGVTLLPPASLSALIEAVQENREAILDPAALGEAELDPGKAAAQLGELTALLRRAREAGAFVICYGV